MPLCPAGASPKATAPATYWITSQDIMAWVGADQYSRLAPWIWNLAEQAVSIPQLCSTEPEDPGPITNQTILEASGDPIAAIVLVRQLQLFGRWWVWSQQCQCNGTATCTTETNALDYNTNLAFVPSGPGFVWPSNSHGTDQNATAQYHPWPAGCTGVNITIWQGAAGSPNQPQLHTRIVGCSGIIYDQSHIMGTPVHVNLTGTCAPGGGPGFWLEWFWNVDPTNYQQWTVTVVPDNTSGPPTPAPPPQVTNITVVAKPAPSCSTIGDLCNIVWNIKNFFSLVQQNQYFNTAPVQYQGGTETTISGQGELAVAPGTLGLAVTVISQPPMLDPRPTDPAEFWNLGWIRTGNTVGWDRKAWIRTSGQRVFPPWPSLTRYAWTLADQVVLSVEELMPITP